MHFCIYPHFIYIGPNFFISLSYKPSPNCSLSSSVLVPFIWHSTSYLNDLSTEQRWLWLNYLPLLSLYSSWATGQGTNALFWHMWSLKIGTKLNYIAFLHYCFSRLLPHEKSHRLAKLHVLNSIVSLFLSWLSEAFPTYLDRKAVPFTTWSTLFILLYIPVLYIHKL